MTKKILTILIAGLLSVGLVACGGENKKEASGDTKQETKQEDKKEDKQEDKKKKDDVWTYFDDAKWEDNYEGLKTEIEKAVVTDKAPSSDGKGTSSAVGVKIKVTNTTKEKFTTYPDQAVLVTSTGEQIQMPNLIGTDHIGGEIDEGVTKKGDVVWYLKKDGTAKDIEWIKLKWHCRKGSEDDFKAKNKEYEIKLHLKK